MERQIIPRDEFSEFDATHTLRVNLECYRAVL